MQRSKKTFRPVVSILLSISSVQVGAAVAERLFPVIGALGTTAVRTGVSAIILLAVVRPPMRRFTAAQWRAVVPYGITIGAMNLVFYQAIARIPLGSPLRWSSWGRSAWPSPNRAEHSTSCGRCSPPRESR